MKKLLISLFVFVSVLSWANTPVDYVNPLMGTASSFAFSHGNTYPAVARPWGMNFWSPQTGENGSGWMYCYGDSVIRGFRQTHQPSPWINDYGTFSIMPMSGELLVDARERGLGFGHSDELATPYCYEVGLSDGTRVKMTSTRRGAVFSVKFREGVRQFVVLDAYNKAGAVKVDSVNNRIVGWTNSNSGGVPDGFANYFVVDFDNPIVGYGTFVNGAIAVGNSSAENYLTGAYAEFKLKEGDSLTIRVASSFISDEQAELNFEREVKDKSFEEVEQESYDEWNEMLSRVEVEGVAREEDLATFYSCLYRALLFPREFYEYDKDGNPIYYSPYDGEVHSGYMYTDNGFWDTFRSVHPLFTLLYPEVSERVMQSLVNVYNESGFLPEWASPGHRGCMIGNNSLSLITDAYVNGVRGFDTGRALQAMIHQTEAQGREASVGRNGWRDYEALGYVPYPKYVEATAKTLEYAYADWCLSQYAKALGENMVSEEFAVKAMNYKNLFDTVVGFMRAKNEEGEWVEPFDAVEWGGPFTEGCSWHYTWSVLHDVEGLARLMGGYEKMGAKLDSMFSAPNVFNYGTYGFVIHEIAEMVALDMGQYAHGNQPVQHAIYLYDYIQQPWKTQQRVREVMRRLYTPTPDGYCGDEDNGQTSAWYVFSAMGFYPLCPGTGEYAMGSPLFKRVKLHLPEGKVFVIEASKNSEENVYVKKAKLNGKAFDDNYLTHEQISAGGSLVLEMSGSANEKRVGNTPYSMSK